MRRERRLRTLVPTAPGPAAAGQGANERDGMDLEEAFLRGMTQTDASADATVSWEVFFFKFLVKRLKMSLLRKRLGG